MKHYIYTMTEGEVPRDGSGIKRTVTLYRITRGTPVMVGQLTRAFMNANQMVFQILREKKELPKTTLDKFRAITTLKDEGVANINQV